MPDFHLITQSLRACVTDTLKTGFQSGKQWLSHSWQWIQEIPSLLRNHPKIAVILAVDGICLVVLSKFVKFIIKKHDENSPGAPLTTFERHKVNVGIIGGLTYLSLHTVSYVIRYPSNSKLFLALAITNVALYYLHQWHPWRNQSKRQEPPLAQV